MPLISIVIPAYNAKKHLAQTVESVLDQTVADWELVIVDDGSKDGTASLAQELVAQDPRIRVVQQENGGVAAARNNGYAHTDPSSEFVIFLNADDVWEPDALETLVGALDAHPEAVAAHGKMRFIDGHGQPCMLDELPRHQKRHAIVNGRLATRRPWEPTTFAALVVFDAISTPGQLLMRRHAFDTLGPFDSAVTPAEDWDMWLRLSMRGDIAFADTTVLNYRQHSANASRHKDVM